MTIVPGDTSEAEIADAIPAPVLRALLDAGTELKFAAGQLIHQAGDVDRSITVILAGQVRFRRIDENGQEMTIAAGGRFRTFGEIPFLTGKFRTLDAVAETTVRLTRIPFAKMQYLIDNNDDIRNWMMANLAHSLNRALERLDEKLRRTATQHVGQALVDRNVGGRVSLRQSDLALRLNFSRKTVNEALRELRERGWIATGYGTITVLDHEKLAEYARAIAPDG